MTLYKVATGHDVALVSMTDIAPQPAMPAAIQTAERSYGLTGATFDNGKFVEYIWTVLGGVTAYQTILTAFGVASVLYADVTVYVRDETFTWARYNGVAHRPQPGSDLEWRRGFPVNVRLLVTQLDIAA